MCSLKISQSSCRVIILPSEEIIKKSLHFIFGSHSTPLWPNVKMFWKFTTNILQSYIKTNFYSLLCYNSCKETISLSHTIIMDFFSFFHSVPYHSANLDYFKRIAIPIFCLICLFNWIIFLICVTSITWKYIQRNSKWNRIKEKIVCLHRNVWLQFQEKKINVHISRGASFEG